MHARLPGSCVAALLAMGVLAGCANFAPQSENGSGGGLAGTQWQLVAIRAADPARELVRIPQPERFVARFGGDGRMAFRLDCNRGMGSWKASPDADGHSGRIEFGAIAVTRALCPPPHMDERIARDLADVRAYRLEQGRLLLLPAGDGDVYEWVPAPRDE